MNVRVLVVNHNRNRAAYELCRGFRGLIEVVSIDSGSELTSEERAWFTLCLPNVYYAGLFDAAVRTCSDLDAEDVLCFVC